MKKLLVGMLLIIAMFAFGACGDSENKESTSTQFDSYVGGELTNLMAAVEESDYTATYFNQGEDWTELLPLDETWAQDFLVGKIEEDPGAKTIRVDLKLKANQEQEDAEAALSEKLETGSAWVAAQKYGQELYGEDFEINYLIGNITESAEDENTWFLKATGELNGEDVTCEAKVTGTTDAPEVLSLDVY